MEISACYCDKCGLLNTYWVIHKGELFECECGSRNAKCIGHYFDSSFFGHYGPVKPSDPVLNAQGQKLVSIRQPQLSLEFLEALCRQFGFFVRQDTLQHVVQYFGKEKQFAADELRNIIIGELILKLDRDRFYRHLQSFRDVQGLAGYITVHSPRVDKNCLMDYLQSVRLPLSSARVRQLDTHIHKHCYGQRRERFLFTEDFKAVLEEYEKGYRVIVSDEPGIMGHGGVSESFQRSDRSQTEVQEFTEFCRRARSKYYYYVDYEADLKGTFRKT